MDDTQPANAAGNLLVVDDDLEARQTMEAFLGREGYEVRCAPSGETALLFSREDPPELILLDIRLPDVDGFEVCRRLKQDRGTRDIPVIFISGLGEVLDKVKGFEAGGVDYIIKPFQAEEVLARVKTHLAIRHLQERIEAQNEALEERVKERTAKLEGANQQLRASEESLAERLKFETLLSEISGRFVKLSADRIDNEIEDAQRRICECLGLDMSVLWQLQPDAPGLIMLTHLYRPLGGPPVPERMEAQAYFPWVLQQMTVGKAVVFSSLEELPEESARDQKAWRHYGVKSLLAFPIATGDGALIGAVSFSAMLEERTWPEMLVKRIQMVAQVFANALVRKRMEEELKRRLLEIEALKDRLESENIYLQEEVKLLVEHSEIVGQSNAVKQILAQAEQVAATDSTVLILGETGTGKELLARAIYKISSRRDRPLITVNCASLPPTLIEGELFGREKGAYTGAMTQMVGRFELADGSTLFLDEIGELPPEIQSKLLRVLEEGRFERLGSTKSLHADVRIMAATNRDMARDVKEGRFRKDLYYRLNVFPISIPPLRERLEDIPQLVWVFVEQFEKKIAKRIESIPKKSMQALKSYSWPGNVRELKNVIERAMIVSRGGTLSVDLPKPTDIEIPEILDLDSVTRRHLLDVLDKTNWRISGKGGAAEILGLKRTTLQSLMARLGIRRPTV